MYTVRRSTVNNPRRPQKVVEPPPKKKKTGLIVLIIIIIVILIVVVVLVVFFLRRRANASASTSTPTLCKSNADCTGGKKCNVVTGQCIQCFNDTDCSGATPVCNLATATCIAGCTVDSDCSGATPVCDTGAKICVAGCVTSADCTTLAEPICDTVNKTCVGCLFNTDCTGVSEVCEPSSKTCVPGCFDNTDCSGATPVCNLGTNLCVACLANSDCSGATPACDLGTQTCVECTNNGDCSGNTPVCKTATKSCVTCLTNADCTAPASICNTTTNVCAECFTDADCTLPDTCNTTTQQCCVETTQSPITNFAVSQIGTTAGVNPDYPLMNWVAEFPQDPTKVKAAIRMYSSTGVFLDKTASFTPTANTINIIQTTDLSSMLNGTLVHSNVSYKWALEIRSGCETWTEISSLGLPFITAGRNCQNGSSQLQYPDTASASVATRDIALKWPFDAGTMALGITLDRTPAYPNDYDYIFRNVPSVADGYGGFISTVTIPAGPTLTAGVTTWAAIAFREAPNCLGLISTNNNNSLFYYGDQAFAA